MDFAFDVIFVEQPLSAATSQLLQNGSRGAGDEREHAAGAEVLALRHRRTGRLAEAPGVRQVKLQRIAHDILETQPAQCGLRLRVPEQTLRDIYRSSHKCILASPMRLCSTKGLC